MIDKDIIFKEIELIQSCIERMAHNSFIVKGWALSIFAGVTAITKGENLSDIILLIFTTGIPFICFWILDTYFLQTERRFRNLYSERMVKRNSDDATGLFELDLKIVKAETFIKVMFSKTLFIFYGIPFITSIIYLIFLILRSKNVL